MPKKIRRAAVLKMDNDFEMSPIINQSLTASGSIMTNFKGVGLAGGGDTHFSYVEGQGFHLTTRLPGGFTLHDNILDGSFNSNDF